MAIIDTGKIFSNGEQLTAGKLNLMLSGSSFGSGAVDGNKITTVGGALTIAPGGVTLSECNSDELLLKLYPVGSVYINANVATNPSTLMGFGTWTAFGAGRVPVGIDSSDTDFDTGEETGGAKTHTLLESELPQHHHLAAVDGFVEETGDVTASNAISENATQSGSTFQSYRLRPATTSTFGTVGRTSQVGSDSAHNNLQPYIVVYMWKRTA
jgi:hypothetical protein